MHHFHLLLSVILAINLLIAILSTTYAILWEQSAPIFYIENIKQRPLYKYSKRYGSLVSSFFPYYIFIPFVAPLLFMKNKIHKNVLILYFEFFPVYLILHIIFLSISILLLPVSYFKIIIHKIYLINHKRSGGINYSKCHKIVNLFIYILFGLLFGIIQTLFFDSIKFTKHIYDRELLILNSLNRSRSISKTKLMTIINFLQENIYRKYSERKQRIEKRNRFDEFYGYFSEGMRN